MDLDPIEATLEVVAALDEMSIPYFIAGSLATAVHGVARATMDVDVVVDLAPTDVASLSAALETSFYVDENQMYEALLHQTSFNIIHRASMFKVDIFPRQARAFDTAQFERRRSYVIGDNPSRAAYFASPEDNILAKLEWYRMGGETSTRQWQDILNVLKIQGERIDLGYLQSWAEKLKLDDLLTQALQEIL